MGNLVKIAPEHVRPVSALEHELIPTPRHPRAPETSNPPQTLQDPAGPNSMGQETNTSQENIERPQSNASEEQPDTEPELTENEPENTAIPPVEDVCLDLASVPVPVETDDELVLCMDTDAHPIDKGSSEALGRRAEILVDDQDIEQWKQTNKEPRFCVRCQFFQT